MSDNEAQAAEGMMGEGENMMMDEKAADENTPLNETSDSRHRTIDNSEVCCCCICQCSRPETKDLTCFGCFPIKCGIVAIGILTCGLIISSFTEIFYFILNDFIHWWYVLVAVILLIPAIISVTF
jgi:hypothetical protein